MGAGLDRSRMWEPLPCRRSISPSETSRARACRTVWRLT